MFSETAKTRVSLGGVHASAVGALPTAATLSSVVVIERDEIEPSTCWYLMPLSRWFIFRLLVGEGG